MLQHDQALCPFPLQNIFPIVPDSMNVRYPWTPSPNPMVQGDDVKLQFQ